MVTTDTYQIDVQLHCEPPSVTLQGSIDSSAAACLSALLSPLVTIEKPVLLDLGNVESIDAAGVAPLFDVCARRSHPAVITAASKAAALAITELGLPANLTVLPDLVVRRTPHWAPATSEHAVEPDHAVEPEPHSSQTRDARVRAQFAPNSDLAWPLLMSRQLRRQATVEDVMQQVEQLAPGITGCVQACLISAKAKVGPVGTSAALTTFLHELAADCLDVEDHLVVIDLSADSRGASLSAEATDSTGCTASAVAWYLANGAGRRPAALVLTFPAAKVIDDAALQLVDAYAELADVALAHQHANEQLVSLRTALDSNREIGTAMGILMATRQINDEEAFGLLRSVSQHSHRKLNVVASEVVYTGMLPA